MHKLKFEPFYNKLTVDQAINSGYFIPKHNKIDWKQHVNIPCTPINFLDKLDGQFDKPAIIISTGAHCPLHQGHIESMINAEKVLTMNGYNVIGGYLSPGHDEYIKEKTGDNWMPIQYRLKWANELIKDHKWLAIDPWEGVFAPGAVNFTSVVHRLQLYIKKFYKHRKDVKIFFVCGADNARFAVPFVGTDIGCVITKRPGYEDLYSYYYDTIKSDTILFASGNNGLSSTEVRKTPEYASYKKEVEKQLYFRLGSEPIENELLVELKNHFSAVWPQYIHEQHASFYDQVKSNQLIVNLDSETPTGEQIKISRLYDFYGQKKLGYTGRNKKDSVAKQIKNMLINNPTTKECYLFDDDICTGSTMDFVEKNLNLFGIKVKGRLSYVSGQSPEKEVLDAKDFLLGFQNGGLVTEFNKDLIRVPYIYPFVCPTTRASIKDPLQFSINVWKINYQFWEHKDTAMLYWIKELNWLTKLGFKANTKVKDVCQYYINFLTNLQKYNG